MVRLKELGESWGFLSLINFSFGRIAARGKFFGILSQTCFLSFSCLLIYGCASSQPTDKSKEQEADKQAAASEKIDDLDDNLDDLSSSGKKAAPKPQLSTEGKKTGSMVDGVIINQQNEFLGMSTLKMSKLGVRLESPSITVIMLPGKEAIAYNSQNGNCMALTERSAALLAGSKNFDNPGEEKITKVGTEKIAGLDCIHYDVMKYYQDPKTKKQYPGWSTDVWACKDIGVPSSIVNDCARLTMMPKNLGFPVRIVREARTTDMEKRKGATNANQKRPVINTSKFAKAKLDKGEFAEIEGFKKVKDEMQLMMSGDDSELIGTDLEEELDKK